MDANTTRENVLFNAQYVRNFSLVEYAMMKQSIINQMWIIDTNLIVIMFKK